MENDSGHKFFNIRETETKKTLLASILMERARVVVIDRVSDRFCISVTERGNANKEVVFDVTSEAERNEWITSFLSLGAFVRTPLKQGWLWKTGSVGTAWRKRWFVLYQDSIQYFKDRDTENESGEIALDHILNRVQSVDDIGNCGNEKGRTFTISSIHPLDARVFLINAPTEKERMTWISALTACLHMQPMHVYKGSLREGYMMLADKNVNKRVYVILLDKQLLIRINKHDVVETTSLDLTKGLEVEEVKQKDEAAASQINTIVLSETGDTGEKMKVSLIADSSEHSYAWLQELWAVRSMHYVKKHPESELEGYIWVDSSSNGTYTKRYVVFAESKLIQYKKKSDPSSCLEIPIDGETFFYTVGQSTEKDKKATTDKDKRKDDKAKYVFSVAASGDEDASRFYMSVPTSVQMMRWVNTLVNFVKKLRTYRFEDSLLEGYMFNQPPGMRWAKMFMSLRQDGLYSYRRKKDPKAFGFIPLPSQAEVRADTEEERGLKVYRVILSSSGDAGSRSTYLRTYTQKEQNQWTMEIEKLITSKQETTKKFEKSIKEGYLFKTDRSLAKWNKRYFVLLHDKLLYFRKHTDEKSAGEILIYGGTLVSIIPRDSESEPTRVQKRALAKKMSSKKLLMTKDLGFFTSKDVLAGTTTGSTKDLTKDWSSQKETSQSMKETSQLREHSPPQKAKRQSMSVSATSRSEFESTPSPQNQKAFVTILVDDIYETENEDCRASISNDRADDTTVGWEAGSQEPGSPLSPRTMFEEPKSPLGAPAVDGKKDKEKEDTLTFSLMATEDEGERKFLLQAMKPKDFQEWVAAITELISTKAKQVDKIAIMEGYLEMYRESKWIKFYLVLRRNKLYFFHNKPRGGTKTTEEIIPTSIENADNEINLSGDSVVKYLVGEQIPESTDKKDSKTKNVQAAILVLSSMDETEPQLIIGGPLEQVDKWIWIMSCNITTMPINPVSKRSEYEGYLFVADPQKKGTPPSKQYFLLIGSLLVAYRGKFERGKTGQWELDDKFNVFQHGDAESELRFTVRLGVGDVLSVSCETKAELRQWMIVLTHATRRRDVRLFGTTITEATVTSKRIVPDLCYDCLNVLCERAKELDLDKKDIDYDNDVKEISVVYERDLVGELDSNKAGFISTEPMQADVASMLTSPNLALCLLQKYFKKLQTPLIAHKLFSNLVATAQRSMEQEKGAESDVEGRPTCGSFDQSVVIELRDMKALWGSMKTLLTELPNAHKMLLNLVLHTLNTVIRANPTVGMDRLVESFSCVFRPPEDEFALRDERESGIRESLIGDGDVSNRFSNVLSRTFPKFPESEEGEPKTSAHHVVTKEMMFQYIVYRPALLRCMVQGYHVLFPTGAPKTYKIKHGITLKPWEKFINEDGKVQYINTQTKEAFAEPPRYLLAPLDWKFRDIMEDELLYEKLRYHARNMRHTYEGFMYLNMVAVYKKFAKNSMDGAVDACSSNSRTISAKDRCSNLSENYEPEDGESHEGGLSVEHLPITERSMVDLFEQTGGDLYKRALCIYAGFLHEDAPALVNISQALRDPLDAIFAKRGQEDKRYAFNQLTTPQKIDIFENCKDEIKKLIALNDVSNFKTTKEFQDYVKELHLQNT